MMESNPNEWLRVIHPEILPRLGKIRHALFDFDGTLSVLRQGWETVMIPVMVESIVGDRTAPLEIVEEVKEYVDRSTGILTLLQMQWLDEAVRRHGLVKNPLTAAEYKALYLQRLMATVRQRIAQVADGRVDPHDRMVMGAADFLVGLRERGVWLYAASGTDHADVVHEAGVLGLAGYFDGRIYGALDQIEAQSKEKIIQRILDENFLSGEELLVVGDGPVELRAAKAVGAVALGLASDEEARQGWNELKTQRLLNAGADLMVADFSRANALLALLFNEA